MKEESKPISYINKILINPKKYNPYSHFKPAVKDSNFHFTNCISFNMIENLTQFKNKEITDSNLNLRLLGNLSFLFIKKKITTKKNKLKLKEKKMTDNNKTNNNNNLKNNKIKDLKPNNEINDFNILDGYECYIPTRRIPYFNKKISDKIIIRKDNTKIVKKIHKEIKIPSNLRDINFFRPMGKIFSQHSTKIIGHKNSLNLSNTSDGGGSDGLNNSLSLSNNNCDDINDGNDSSGDYDLICGESNNNIFHEKEFINLLKTSPTFPKYSDLSELIECPLEESYSPEMKYQNYMKILDEFINDDNCDYNNMNETNNKIEKNNKNLNLNNIILKTNQENPIINLTEDTNNQKVFIINPCYLNHNTDDIDNYNKRKISLSGKLIKVDTKLSQNFNYSIINKTFKSDDYDEYDTLRKDNIDDDKLNNPSKKIDLKIKKILPKSATKYMNQMSNLYIILMYEKYKIIYGKMEKAKNILIDEVILKKLFVQMLKQYILNIGISSKKFYEKILKCELNSKDNLNFEHYMNIFDIILMENNKENSKFKFLFLLKIIPKDDDNNYIMNEKQINMFFDLIGCERVYIRKFCEILGEKLLLRYKVVYHKKKNDKNNINKTFIYIKVKTILESFLNILDS